ncbi:hypothetical protein IBX35_04655 [Candidatus Bathyarchaeota archaeon]|nr:hypothetical protein [Candidatus Bathyarchaeota archaeon]
MADFFLNYKKLEPRKWVKVKGREDTKVAENTISLTIQRYKEKIEKQLYKSWF